MIEEFYYSPDDLINSDTKSRYMEQRHSGFIRSVRLGMNKNILDADQRTPFTKRFEKYWGVSVDTLAECDCNWNFPSAVQSNHYDIVLSSHVIEHLCNPLLYLVNIHKVLKVGGVLYIAYPQRPKFLWVDHHFHEIDHYRFGLLAKEAGFDTVQLLEKRRMPKHPLFYFSGIRPLLRFFFDMEVQYMLINRINKSE